MNFKHHFRSFLFCSLAERDVWENEELNEKLDERIRGGSGQLVNRPLHLC